MKSIDTTRIAETAERALSVFSTPAASVAVAQDGEIVYQAGFGSLELNGERKADENSSYAIASMSKSTTAAALAMLADEGKLDWTDKVRKYLPDFQLRDPVASDAITLKDLLIHNCGLKSESGGTIWYGSDYSRAEVTRRLRYLRPDSEFRSAFAYQNVCYLVAGEAVQAISGMSWDDFVKERLFAPLEMTRTTPTYAALLSSGMDNVAAPHALIRGELKQIPYRDHDNCGPAASVHSTAVDLARYLQFFLRGGKTADGVQLLSPRMADFLHYPHSLRPFGYYDDVEHPRLKANFPAYGLGWFIQDYCGFKEVAHSGGVDGMRGRMTLFPEKNCAAVVLTNSENRNAYRSILYTVYDMLLGVEPVDWIAVFQSGEEAERAKIPSAPTRVLGTSPSYALSAYVGDYEDQRCGVIRVENDGGRLRLSFTHTSAFSADLSHWQNDTFRMTWRDAYIPDGFATFNLDSCGRVASLSLNQPRLLDVDFTELEPAMKRVRRGA